MQRIRSKQQKCRDGHKTSEESNESQAAGKTHCVIGEILCKLLVSKHVFFVGPLNVGHKYDDVNESVGPSICPDFSQVGVFYFAE